MIDLLLRPDLGRWFRNVYRGAHPRVADASHRRCPVTSSAWLDANRGTNSHVNPDVTVGGAHSQHHPRVYPNGT